MPLRVSLLEHPDDEDLQGLTRVLVDCVTGGASVSFMNPLPLQKAMAFWQDVARSVVQRERLLYAAVDGASIVGTVQVVLKQPDNQPHRGDVAKLLVLQQARGRGVGAALMEAAEAGAAQAGKTLLVLDTASAQAERLYERLNWQRCGVIPDFALLPDGGFCATTIFYKRVGPANSSAATAR